MTTNSFLPIVLGDFSRRGARVAEWDGLENRCTGNCTEGSNPSLSAAVNVNLAKSIRSVTRCVDKLHLSDDEILTWSIYIK